VISFWLLFWSSVITCFLPHPFRPIILMLWYLCRWYSVNINSIRKKHDILEFLHFAKWMNEWIKKSISQQPPSKQLIYNAPLLMPVEII
jgi:hypothetical protein